MELVKVPLFVTEPVIAPVFVNVPVLTTAFAISAEFEELLENVVVPLPVIVFVLAPPVK